MNLQKIAEEKTAAYRILGLEPDADATVFKKAYRVWMRQNHSDHGGHEEDVKIVNNHADNIKRHASILESLNTPQGTATRRGHPQPRAAQTTARPVNTQQQAQRQIILDVVSRKGVQGLNNEQILSSVCLLLNIMAQDLPAGELRSSIDQFATRLKRDYLNDFAAVDAPTRIHALNMAAEKLNNGYIAVTQNGDLLETMTATDHQLYRTAFAMSMVAQNAARQTQPKPEPRKTVFRAPR